MRDREIIQYPGFRNIYDDAGNAIGFEFRIRSNYYRGVYLSLLNVGRVTVDGEEIGRYYLNRDGTFSLNGGSNVLVVENGEAWVSEANCPDKVCMGMGKISRNGEFIACLPNRLIIVVEGGEQSPIDGKT